MGACRGGSESAAPKSAAAQPRFSTGTGKSYQLGRIEQQSLEQGNTYAFGLELLKAYPEFAKEQGFGRSEASNSYQRYIDFSDGIFTFWDQTGSTTKKHFFDTKMKYRGTKL